MPSTYRRAGHRALPPAKARGWSSVPLQPLPQLVNVGLGKAIFGPPRHARVQSAQVDELVEVLSRETELLGSLSDRKSFFSLSRHIEVLGRRVSGDLCMGVTDNHFARRLPPPVQATVTTARSRIGGLRLLRGFGHCGWDAGTSGCLPPLAVLGNRAFPPRTSAASISRARVGRSAGRLLRPVSIVGTPIVPAGISRLDTSSDCEMRKPALHVVRTEPAPSTEVDTHGPRREYVTEDEVERLIRAASKHEWGDRDALMILMAYRHGLRVSELIGVQWAQVDLDAGRLRVRRLKGSDDSVHPLGGREIRTLRKLRRKIGVKSARRAVNSASISVQSDDFGSARRPVHSPCALQGSSNCGLICG